MDSQSRELFIWMKEVKENPNSKSRYLYCASQDFVQFQLIGSYKGDVIAFRFNNNHRPLILFEYQNGNFQNSLDALLKFRQLVKTKRNKKNGYSSLGNDQLVITFTSLSKG
jgi:hypothetical protein